MNERKFFNWCSRCGALLALALWALPVSAQTNAAKESPSRFLFIVDTSATMRRRAPAMQKAIEKLIHSGLSGQLRPGDTVGAWTFDEELYAGRFPLQLWSTETSESVASNVVAFLKAQSYQKKSKFEVVVPALQRVVKYSNKLTVLLVTDGDEKISGTPFNREIQSALERHFKMQQDAREPFITVLRSSRGRFINATVNLMPWPVEFPAFPPELAIAEAPKPKPPEQTPVPHPAIPSLIVTGKKPEPTTATNVTDVAAAAANAPVQAEITNPSITPTPPQLNPSEIRSSPAPIPSPAPTGSVTPAPLPIVESKPASSPAPPRSDEPVQVPPATAPAETPAMTHAPEAPTTTSAVSPTNKVAPSSPLAPIALAIQPEPGFSRLGMIAIGVALVLLAGGLFFVMQRRARNAAQASLITRSMDRNRK
jgi:hypothetical protein